MWVAAHQPQFLPWPGFWAKADVVSHLVLMSGVQYDKGQVSNRVRLDGQWMTLPVQHTLTSQLSEVRFDPRHLRKITSTIRQTLMSGKNKYGGRLERVITVLEETGSLGNLTTLNVALIECVADMLGIRARITHDSNPLIGEGKTARLEEFLIRNIPESSKGRATYLSGMGGKEYLEAFSKFDTRYCTGVWEDCSILQLIARNEDPLSIVRSTSQFINPLE